VNISLGKKTTVGLIYEAKWIPLDSSLIKLNCDVTFRVLEIKEDIWQVMVLTFHVAH